MTPVLISGVQADPFNDDAATAQTVALMGEHVRDSWQDPEVRNCALQAVTNGSQQPQTAADIAACVWAWCKANIEFVEDQKQLAKIGLGQERELLISPKVMARTSQRKGDCDCFTMMADAMCAALGVTPLIKTIKCDADESGRWSHVCGAVLLENGAVMTIDASHGEYPGWEVPAHHVYDSQLWDMQGRKVGPSKMQAKGLSGYVPYQGWSGLPAGTPVADCWRGMSGVMRRRAGLAGIRNRRFGMGDDSGSGEAGTEGSSIPGSLTPYETPTPSSAPGPNYVDSVTGMLINGATGQVIGPSVSNSGSSTVNSLLASLFGAGTQLGTAAINQNKPLVIAQPSTSLLGGTSGTSILMIALVVGAVVLVASKK